MNKQLIKILVLSLISILLIVLLITLNIRHKNIRAIQNKPTSSLPELVIFTQKNTYKINELIKVDWRNWNIPPSDQNYVQIDMQSSDGSCGIGFDIDTRNQIATGQVREIPCIAVGAESGISYPGIKALEGNPYKITATLFGDQASIVAKSNTLFINIK